VKTANAGFGRRGADPPPHLADDSSAVTRSREKHRNNGSGVGARPATTARGPFPPGMVAESPCRRLLGYSYSSGPAGPVVRQHRRRGRQQPGRGRDFLRGRDFRRGKKRGSGAGKGGKGGTACQNARGQGWGREFVRGGLAEVRGTRGSSSRSALEQGRASSARAARPAPRGAEKKKKKKNKKKKKTKKNTRECGTVAAQPTQHGEKKYCRAPTRVEQARLLERRVTKRDRLTARKRRGAQRS